MAGRRVTRVVRYVYADVLLLINAAMNYLLLWHTARWLRHPWSVARGGLAALLGGIYAVGLWVPGLAALYSGAGRVVLGLLMLAVAFPGMPARILGRAAACFLGLTLVAAGAAFAAHFALAGGRDISQPVAWWTLGGAAVATTLLGWVLPGLARSHQWQKAQCLNVRVELEQDSVELVALLDTGNRLTDPLTGLPVMVVECGALGDLVPREFRLASGADPLSWAKEELPAELASRVRLIPYRGIGSDRGLLLGFRPDRVVLESPAAAVTCHRVVIALYERTLCPDGLYRALVPPQMLESGDRRAHTMV